MVNCFVAVPRLHGCPAGRFVSPLVFLVGLRFCISSSFVETRVTFAQGHFEVGRCSSCLPSTVASAEYACDSKVLKTRFPSIVEALFVCRVHGVD